MKAWSLQLLDVDHDPGSKLGPSIAHDLELSCDGQQLTRARVCYVYCEFFHFLSTFKILPFDQVALYRRYLVSVRNDARITRIKRHPF